MARTLIVVGIILIAIGVAWLLAGKLGLGRLLGDIVIQRGNVQIHIPIMTSIIISVVLSLLFWLYSR